MMTLKREWFINRLNNYFEGTVELAKLGILDFFESELNIDFEENLILDDGQEIKVILKSLPNEQNLFVIDFKDQFVIEWIFCTDDCKAENTINKITFDIGGLSCSTYSNCIDIIKSMTKILV